jgi:hypothetical protein
MFFEPHPLSYEPVASVAPQSPMRFAWEDTVRRLDAEPRNSMGPYGTEIKLGDPAMKTIGLP